FDLFDLKIVKESRNPLGMPQFQRSFPECRPSNAMTLLDSHTLKEDYVAYSCRIKRNFFGYLMSPKENTPFVVTIDGPAGSGKSTVSAILARKLNLTFLTTGSFYRGLAVLCSRKNVDISDSRKVAEMTTYRGFEVKANAEGTKVFIDREEVTEDLLQSEE